MTEMAEEAKWYVVHTYSGYENAVAAAIMKSAENRRMQDLIFEVNIPMETVTEHTDAGEKTVERKVFHRFDAEFFKFLLIAAFDPAR